MSDVMYPHTVTYWHRGEKGRSASWTRVLIPEAHYESQIGRSRIITGDAASDIVYLSVPGRSASLVDWHAGDRFILGDVSDTKPPDDSRQVTYAEPVYLGGSVDHVEMGAE